MHPLITRLITDLGWPLLDSQEALDAFTAQPGAHALFVPGDAVRNLETADVAVILPELAMAFQGRFDCAVVGDTVEAGLRTATGVLKTPGVIFYRAGRFVGGIAKVRDWDEYLSRITQILSRADAA
ncbi:hydrogenase accessory protein [Roseovarius autotrophicus]|uniref:hydrogenase accessory protein n=1 Tax=Roseovarius autotrophicus TaxID=2824121 RepID=UPI001A019421|nr:hydrogenase accessory protein [Roseovarius autotrophicus]MBE0452163.1 hydrogenase accessory protein [Roseovarius sp.]